MSVNNIFDGSQKVHIVGIGGAGMSAIAEILRGKGVEVSGSDLTDSSLLELLSSRGVTVTVGHSASAIDEEVTVVTHSTAIPFDNPELVEARKRGLPVLRRAEILSILTEQWKTLAVAGTHGKTTTSAMLTSLLVQTKMNPSYIVGGKISGLDRGAAVGSGDYLVVEADESDGTFIELDVFGSIITNIEPDHLEHYGGFENLKKAFVTFAERTAGVVVGCIDDSGVAELASSASMTTYGTASEADWQITSVSHTDFGISFVLKHESGEYPVALRQPGLHNARNATAAFVLAVSVGGDPVLLADALQSFEGVGRRFERRGAFGGIQLVDDYAHLPTEVEAALAAAKTTGCKRLVTVFQPHRYSRTEELWDSFGSSFHETDVLIITGIYSSGEKPRPGITSELLVRCVSENDPSLQVLSIPTLSEVVSYLVTELQDGDLCLTLGAGDLTTIPDDVLSGLKNRG